MKPLKLIALSILFLDLIGIFSFKTTKSIYTIRENIAFGQEAEPEKKEPEKETADGEDTANEKGEPQKKEAEKRNLHSARPFLWHRSYSTGMPTSWMACPCIRCCDKSSERYTEKLGLDA